MAFSKAGKAATTALPLLRQLVADPKENEVIKTLAMDAIKKVPDGEGGSGLIR
jgi:hypothetical protein